MDQRIETNWSITLAGVTHPGVSWMRIFQGSRSQFPSQATRTWPSSGSPRITHSALQEVEPSQKVIVFLLFSHVFPVSLSRSFAPSYLVGSEGSTPCLLPRIASFLLRVNSLVWSSSPAPQRQNINPDRAEHQDVFQCRNTREHYGFFAQKFSGHSKP